MTADTAGPGPATEADPAGPDTTTEIDPDELLARSADVAAGCLQASKNLLKLAGVANDRRQRRILRLIQEWEREAAGQPQTLAGNLTRSLLEVKARQLRRALTQGGEQ